MPLLCRHMPSWVLALPGLYTCPHCAHSPVFVARPWASLFLLCRGTLHPTFSMLGAFAHKEAESRAPHSGPSVTWAVFVAGAQQPASPRQPTTGRLSRDGPSSGGPGACLLPGRGLPSEMRHLSGCLGWRHPKAGSGTGAQRVFHRRHLTILPHPLWVSRVALQEGPHPVPCCPGWRTTGPKACCPAHRETLRHHVSRVSPRALWPRPVAQPLL